MRLYFTIYQVGTAEIRIVFKQIKGLVSSIDRPFFILKRQGQLKRYLYHCGMVKEELVVLVNAEDQEIGRMEKQEAHVKGELHRAFSVFLYNEKGEVLLQRRALHKYHSGGLWTNTCCSHPRPEEAPADAAKRRLVEEMGIEASFSHAFSFIYKQQVGDLIEHELDHVFIGSFDGEAVINPEEVAEAKYISVEALKADMALNPKAYTIWFRLCFERVEQFRADGNKALASIPFLS